MYVHGFILFVSGVYRMLKIGRSQASLRQISYLQTVP